jgi:hypothetical protein
MFSPDYSGVIEIKPCRRLTFTQKNPGEGLRSGTDERRQ